MFNAIQSPDLFWAFYSNKFSTYRNSISGELTLFDDEANEIMSVSDGVFVFLPPYNLFLVGKDGLSDRKNKNMLLNFCTPYGIIIFKEWVREQSGFYMNNSILLLDMEFGSCYES
jgi:hypothetical protein